ncbi:MAG: hypothetical protein WAU69_14615 [Solirubrobacteraceae bacterium]
MAVAVSAAAVLWVLPAVATACSVSESKLNGVKSFSGTASEGYDSGTVVWTPPVLSGGTQVTYTESMDRQASDMKLTDLTQADPGSGTFANAAMPSGGTITINDTYSDTLGGMATQSTSGPTIAGGGNGGEGAQIYLNTLACNYYLLIPYAISAPTQANMPGIPADTGVYDAAQTPTMPIPSNLTLKGTATIPASGGGTSASTGAIYDMSADPTWPIVPDSFAAQNDLSGDPGTATVTWDLTPQLSAAKQKPPKKKPHKSKAHKKKPRKKKPHKR